MNRVLTLAAVGLTLAGCTIQPYRPIGYTMPPPGYYAPPPYDPYARARSYTPPASMPAPEPAPEQIPEPEYETPPMLLQPMDPSPSSLEVISPPRLEPAPFAGPRSADPNPSVPMMGFRPMRGQTP